MIYRVKHRGLMNIKAICQTLTELRDMSTQRLHLCTSSSCGVSETWRM